MPELPEVETVAEGLRRLIVGRTIARVTLHAPASSIVVSPTLRPATLDSLLTGTTVAHISRRGKNILIHLSDGLVLWVHLKMTGQFHWVEKTSPVEKHDLVLIDLEPLAVEAMQLRFNDYRRFGRLRLYRESEIWQQKGMKELGPEPLVVTADEFAALALRRPRQIKAALLDQSFLAGVGNIYADEALHAARIHPLRITTSIPKEQLRDLHHHIQRLLKKAIRHMGTSVDSYAGVNGQPGSFQNYLKVYAREDQACCTCGSAIVRKKIGARSAHFCPSCQRPPRRRR